MTFINAVEVVYEAFMINIFQKPTFATYTFCQSSLRSNVRKITLSITAHHSHYKAHWIILIASSTRFSRC